MVQNAAQEILEQKADVIVDALCVEQKTETERKALLDSIQQARTENPTILSTISTKLAAMERGPQRAIANDNLRSLQERIAANNTSPEAQAQVVGLRTEIDAVQKELDALDKSQAAVQPTPPAPEGAKSGGVSPDMQKQIQQNPEKWLPQSMNPKEWTQKQIATVSAITLGTIGIFALWKWARGGRQEGAPASGEKRSKWNLLLWVPFLGLTGYLGYKIWDKYRNDYRETPQEKERKQNRDYLPNALPDVLEKPAEAVIGGVEQGVSRAVEVFGPAATEFINHEHTAEVLQKQQNGEYKSEAAFWTAMIAAMTIDGIDLVVDETSCAILSGGKLIECTTAFWGGLIDGFADGGIDLPEGCDLVATYIEGVFVYATSLAALKMVTLNRFARGVNPMLETGLWPIFVIKRGVKGSWIVVRGAAEIGVADSATRLVIAREVDALRLHKLELGTFTRRFKEATEQGLWLRKEFAMNQWDRLLQAEARNLDPKSIKSFKDVFGKSVEDLHTYVQRIKPENLPDWYTRSVKFKFPNVDPSKVTLVQMRDILKNLDKSTVAAGPKIVDSVDDLDVVSKGSKATIENSPKTAAPEGGDLKKAAGAESMSKPQVLPDEATVAPKGDVPDLKVVRKDGSVVDSTGRTLSTAEAAADAAQDGAKGAVTLDAQTAGKIDNLLTNNKGFAKLLEQSGRPVDEVRQILGQVDGLSPDIMARIEMSPKAQRMLAGALEVKGIAGAQVEAQHVINLANRARVWRLGFNGFGAGADVFGIAMAAVDMWENQERIKNTQNPALKEIYNSAYYMYAGQMGTNAIGLVYSGVYMVAAAKGGAGLMTALSAPAGAVMLPVAVAAIAARATYESLEKSTEYHTLTERDMVRQYTPGKIQQHIGASTSMETMTWTQDYVLPREIALTANRAARWEGYRAYFAQSAPSYIPLGAANGAGQESPEKQKEAIAKEDTERRSFFVGHAIAFIEKRTNGTFDPIKDAQIYQDACMYAQMRFAEKYADATLDVSTDSAVAAYREKQETEMYVYLQSLSKEDPEAFAREVGPVLLHSIRHDMALCEMKLLNAGFSNLSTAAAWSKWYGDADMRCVARGYMAQEIWNTLRSLTQKQCTTENLKNAVTQMKTLLTKDADSISVDAIRTPDHKKYFEIGGSPERLTVPGMADLLNEHQLRKPESLSGSAADPLSVENLRFHYPEQIKGHMPVILKLSPGASEGYLSLKEGVWSRMDGSGNCTKVAEANKITSLALKPGLHQFWYDHSMPQKMVSTATRVSPARYETLSKPDKYPDFEVIVESIETQAA